MSRAGVSVHPECISVYNELKLGRGKHKFVIYKLSDDYKEIVVEEASSEPDWEVFQDKLLSATSTAKGKTGKGPRYAVYDFEYEAPGGEGTRNKIVFIAWSPDEGTPIFARMTYASSKEALKNALTGLAGEIQANSENDIEYETVLKEVQRGKR